MGISRPSVYRQAGNVAITILSLWVEWVFAVMVKWAWACVLLALTMVLPLVALSREPKAEIDSMVLTEGFLAAHPDLRWRREASRSFEKGEYAIALKQFERAAKYADKPSQAMVAEMYWQGLGVSQDRVRGYIWMDLAAERLYPDFVVYRERYWGQMSETERALALELGQSVFAEYGDDAAKPRLERILRRAGHNVTGSRLGTVGNLTIIPFTGPFAGSGMTISGEQYYAAKYWEPEKYWQLQDEIWRAPVRKGQVDVGVPTTVREKAAEQP